jgi:hypothetical protein
MRLTTKVGILGIGCIAAGAGTASTAERPKDGPPAEFAPPVRLKAGEAFLGGGRYYPSPVLHDLDGDGKREILVADLMGSVTFAKITRAEGGAPKISAEAPLLGRDGQPIRFHNW